MGCAAAGVPADPFVITLIMHHRDVVLRYTQKPMGKSMRLARVRTPGETGVGVADGACGVHNSTSNHVPAVRNSHQKSRTVGIPYNVKSYTASTPKMLLWAL